MGPLRLATLLLVSVCACASSSAGDGTCTPTSGCATDEVCGFLVGDGCGAKGRCFPADPGSGNCYVDSDCACDGTNTVACQVPSGYATKPVLHTGPCK